MRCLFYWILFLYAYICFSAFSKTRLPPELRQVLSCESPAVFLHFPLEEKGPWGPFYQLWRVLAKGRHLLQILLKALITDNILPGWNSSTTGVDLGEKGRGCTPHPLEMKASPSYSFLKSVYLISQLRHSLMVQPFWEKSMITPATLYNRLASFQEFSGKHPSKGTAITILLILNLNVVCMCEALLKAL